LRKYIVSTRSSNQSRTVLGVGGQPAHKYLLASWLLTSFTVWNGRLCVNLHQSAQEALRAARTGGVCAGAPYLSAVYCMRLRTRSLGSRRVRKSDEAKATGPAGLTVAHYHLTTSGRTRAISVQTCPGLGQKFPSSARTTSWTSPYLTKYSFSFSARRRTRQSVPTAFDLTPFSDNNSYTPSVVSHERPPRKSLAPGDLWTNEGRWMVAESPITLPIIVQS
jgi:hypothetical protein